MEKKYYITNSANEVESFQLLTSLEDHTEASIVNVSDEFMNGSGGTFEVYSYNLIPISKEDYEHLAKLIGDWSEENEKEFYEKAEELLEIHKREKNN